MSTVHLAIALVIGALVGWLTGSETLALGAALLVIVGLAVCIAAGRADRDLEQLRNERDRW